MKPYLTICIPTYNRPSELGELLRGCLRDVKLAAVDGVEVLVGDNSDDSMSLLNRLSCDGVANYIKNEGNLGYAGNVINLVSRASADYVWIISDNDDLVFDGVREVLNFAKRGDADGLLVKYSVAGREINQAGFIDQNASVSVIDYIRLNSPPFILLSSIVFRVNNRSRINDVARDFEGNHFIQMPLILELLGFDARVNAAAMNSINYTSERERRFDLAELNDSMRLALDYIHARCGIPVDACKERFMRGLAIIRLNADFGNYSICEKTPYADNMSKYAAVEPIRFSSRLLIFALRAPKPFRIAFAWTWNILSSIHKHIKPQA